VLYRRILIVLNVLVLVACSTVEKQHRTVYSNTIQPDSAINIQQAYSVSVLRVATLNLAHGRKDNFNQLFVGKKSHKKFLNDIADVFKQHRPHVVALQEADAASRWSGSFDHVEYLASGAEYPWRTHVINAENSLFSFGTALLSGVPIIESIEHTFEPSPPTLNKGFVLAQIEWNNGDKDKTQKIDLVSVHLDFSRQSVRDKQITELTELLSDRNNPTIIMGDFNSEWLGESSVIKELATNGHFITHEPGADSYNTYKDKRLDWILITKDMEFVNYRVLPDTMSDHAMVIADIRFKASSDEVVKSPNPVALVTQKP
jgi:endonuclease/exonuclease/phosphatase family metal-dependent hydrolase